MTGVLGILNWRLIYFELVQFSKWLVMVPLVGLVLLVSGNQALEWKTAYVSADTASNLSVDYDSWSFISIPKIDPAIIQAILRDGPFADDGFFDRPAIMSKGFWSIDSQQEPNRAAAIRAQDDSGPTGTKQTQGAFSPSVTSTQVAFSRTPSPTPSTSPGATRGPPATPTKDDQSGSSATATQTPSSTPQPTPTDTAVPTSTPTPIPTDTPTLLPTDTPVPTSTPTSPPTDTPVPTSTPTFPPTDTPVPTSTPTDAPTNTPFPTDTPLPTDTPAPTDTPVPTSTPVPTNTPGPTETPTIAPF